MCSVPISKNTPRKDSLTDQILKFCASGQFGVREAIAAAKIDKEEMKEPSAQARAREQKQKERAHSAA